MIAKTCPLNDKWKLHAILNHRCTWVSAGGTPAAKDFCVKCTYYQEMIAAREAWEKMVEIDNLDEELAVM